MIGLLLVGFLWGWSFLPLLFLVAGAADFVDKAYASRFTDRSLWTLKLITLVALLILVAGIYWLTSQALLAAWFPDQGKQFAGAMLVGFLAFAILPRIENRMRKRS